MPRQLWSEGQEIKSVDLNKASVSLERALFDRVFYELMNRQVGICFGDSFLVEYSSSSQVTVKPGVGFQSDATQVNPEPEKRMLYRPISTTKSVTTPDPSNPRIDILCIKANRDSATVSETKNVKAIDGTVAATSIATQTDWLADLVVTAGTPAGSPSAPATPAGYIKLAEITVAAATGIAGAASIADKRPLYQRTSSTFTILTKTADYTVSRDDEMVAGNCAGGAIVFTLPAAATCAGKVLRFYKTEASVNTLTLDGNASEQINDENTQIISVKNTVLAIMSNGTGWIIL